MTQSELVPRMDQTTLEMGYLGVNPIDTTSQDADDYGNFLEQDDDDDDKIKTETEVTGDDDEDDDDDDDSVCSLAKIGKKSETVHIRRNYSLESFLTRSERAALLGKDPPPTPAEERKRRVHFVAEHLLEIVHEVVGVTPEEKSEYWMNGLDFDRQENEVKLTKFRWENHKVGRIKFDENTSTLRGLERVIPDGPVSKKSDGTAIKPWQHAKVVLEEVHRQKTDEGRTTRNLDWNKIREVSIISSSYDSQHAAWVAKWDEEWKDKTWDPSIPSQTTTAKPTTPTKKSKGGFFGFFKKSNSK